MSGDDEGRRSRRRGLFGELRDRLDPAHVADSVESFQLTFDVSTCSSGPGCGSRSCSAWLPASQSDCCFLADIREAQLLALSTSRSAAVMPLSMRIAEERLAVSKPVARFVIPLGGHVAHGRERHGRPHRVGADGAVGRRRRPVAGRGRGAGRSGSGDRAARAARSRRRVKPRLRDRVARGRVSESPLPTRAMRAASAVSGETAARRFDRQEPAGLEAESSGSGGHDAAPASEGRARRPALPRQAVIKPHSPARRARNARTSVTART